MGGRGIVCLSHVVDTIRDHIIHKNVRCVMYHLSIYLGSRETVY